VTIAGPNLARPASLPTLLERGLETRADEPALVLLNETWSFRQLDDASTRLAASYLALGLAPGDRVASLLPNCGALVIHYLACFRAGLVATPLNYRYQTPEIDHALEVSGAALLVAHAERDDTLAASQYASRLPRGRVSYAATSGTTSRLEDLMAQGNASHALPSPQPPTAPAIIYFTSGSTGKPKGVTHSYESFGWLVASAAAGMAITPADVFLPATSASHVAASSFAFAGLAAGACVALARSFGADELLPLLRAARPTLLCMQPHAMFTLVRDSCARADDFASVVRCVAGGDKISAELEQEFHALTGNAIEELYGMTETGTATYNPHGPMNRIGSMGQLGPGYTAQVRGDDGTELPAGTIGQLWIKSPTTMIGYWQRPDATAEVLVDGWLDTGDVVSADEQQYLWFRGRKKQIIVHDGSNICPQEVEESLLEHPAVASAGVIGVHDLVHGENVRAYVALRAGVAPPTVAELIQFSKARVGYKAPDEIVVLDELPVSPGGKVDRTALKQLADAAIHQYI
jgi:long-chain acyl-CoA synthetase